MFAATEQWKTAPKLKMMTLDNRLGTNLLEVMLFKSFRNDGRVHTCTVMTVNDNMSGMPVPTGPLSSKNLLNW